MSHRWLPEERDTLHILFEEYSLHPNGADQVSQIFSDIFPWAVDKGTRIRDEWVSRAKIGRSVKWNLFHIKAFNAYTPMEQHNRHQARLRILQSADRLRIALIAIPGAVALHNAATAVLLIVGTLPVGNFATYRQLRGADPWNPQQNAPLPNISTTTQYQQPPFTGATGMSTAGQQSGASSSSRRGPAITTNPGQTAELLDMVHYRHHVVNVDDTGAPITSQPHFTWKQSQLFGPENALWAAGGLVVEALIKPDGLGIGRGVITDVIVCRLSQCDDCWQAVEYDAHPSEGELGIHGDTGGLPFVHTSACFIEQDGSPHFSPLMSLSMLHVSHRGTEQRQVEYMKGVVPFTMNSAVCIAATCVVCGVAEEQITDAAPQDQATRSSAQNDQDVPSNKRPGDPLHVPDSRRQRRVRTVQGGSPHVGGHEENGEHLDNLDPSTDTGFGLLHPERDEASDRKLCMVHFSDLDQLQQPIPGRPKFQTEHKYIFRAPEEMWALGGHVLNVSVLQTRHRGRDIQAADYHLMMCDRDFCEKCVRVVNANAVARTQNQWFKGYPFVHSNFCVWTDNGLIFRPHWDASIPPEPDVTAYQNVITYFEAGVELEVTSWVCILANCHHCRPNSGPGLPTIRNEPKLRMVHRSDLKANNFQAHFTAGPQALFACLFTDTFGPGSAEWHRFGAVVTAFIPAPTHPMVTGSASVELGSENPGGLLFDLMVCQWGSCKECTAGTSRPYRSFRLPFVHKNDCREGNISAILTFQKHPFSTLDNLVTCEITNREVVYGTISAAPTPFTSIMSAVCVPETCSICSDPTTIAALRVTNGATYEPQALNQPTRQGTTSQLTTSGTGTAVHTPIAPSTNTVPPRLRMCHSNHLVFGPTDVVFDKGTLRAALVNQYYIVDSNSVVKYGGPAYRITVTDGTQVDAVACVKNQCSSCKRKGGEADFAASPTSGEPFVHRSQIALLRGARTFTPVGTPVYDIPTASMQLISVPVSFPQAGVTVQCHICVLGSCGQCDGQPQAGTTRGARATRSPKNARRSADAK